MEPTQAQLDELATVFQIGNSGDAEGWEDLALDPEYMSDDAVASTRDTLDDFREAARKHWAEASAVQEINGGLYWDRVQTRRGEPRASLAVVDCGDFRIAYQQ